MELGQNILVTSEVRIPMVDANNCSFCGLDDSSYRSQDIHDASKAKLG